MTNEEWETVALVLSKGWKGTFGAGEDRAYRLMLDGYGGDEVVLALRKIAASGHHVVPTVGEIVQAIECDPGRPTFEEAFRLIYGVGGILRTLPPYAGPGSRTPEKVAQVRRDLLLRVHPLVGLFVQRFGVEELRMLELDDPEWGDRHRERLRGAWDRHVEAMEGRDAASVAAGVRGRAGGSRALHKFDPLAVLGSDHGQITTGTREKERDDGNDS